MAPKKKFRGASIKINSIIINEEKNEKRNEKEIEEIEEIEEENEEKEENEDLKHKLRKEKKQKPFQQQQNQQEQKQENHHQQQEQRILRSNKKEYIRNDILLRSINMITPTEKKKNITKRKLIKISYLINLPDVIIIYIFSFFISNNGILIDDFLNIQSVDTRFHSLINSSAMWRNISIVKLDGSLNLDAFSFKKVKNRGTEGTCFAARRRCDNQMVALKRARVYPLNEGVPYYMMRELSALKKLNHPNICHLDFVNLHESKLYLLYTYVELSLHDILNPYPPPLNRIKNVIIKKDQVLNIMGQLISAVAYCHSKGILHRNLKPKHLLVIPGNNPLEPLESAQIQLADFALVRTLSTPTKKFTSEVITLWYRPPEILMGQRNYNAAVDIWSIGCIFAELLQGKAIFEGLCEIDQLFQIFRILGTPNDINWNGFTELPNYQDPIFPLWTTNRLWSKVSSATELEFDLLNKCFQYDPNKRSSAQELLSHSYFLNTKYHQIQKEVDQFHNIGLINIQKTTIPQYQFLKSLEDELSVLKYTQLVKNDIYSYNDNTKIGIYSNEEMELRQEAVQWVLCIAGRDESSLSTRTGYFAIALFDAFFHTQINQSNSLTSIKLQRNHSETFLNNKQTIKYANNQWSCQNYSILVGACCLHIASKCEDVSYAGIRDISFSLNEEYGLTEFLLMEETILNILQFNFYLPTVIDFLGIFISIIPEISTSSLSQKSLCMYLGELSLYYGLVCQYKPSLIATSIISYSLTFTTDGGYNSTPNIEWPKSLQILSNYSFQQDILPCINKLRDCMRIAHRNSSNITSSYYYYNHSTNCSVSKWIPHEIK